MSWHTEKIGNLLAKVKRAGKLQATQYQESGLFPVIDQGNNDIAGYSDDPELVHMGPLPIVVFGDHTRRVKLAREPFTCGADGTQLLYPKDDALDPVFFYYAVKNVDLSNYAYARHFKFLKDQEVSYPDLPTQQRIAGILLVYDDLIEKNRRRIGLLEQAARLLYREWFVYLRFPGHDTSKMDDGLPGGWERMPASEAMHINPRTTWKASESKLITMVPMGALSTSGMNCDPYLFERREQPAGVKFMNGDTLFARITPCLENGKTGYVNFLQEGEVACGSTEFVVFRERCISRFMAYLLAREEGFRKNAITSMVGSSGRQRVQPSCFDKYLVPVPPKLVVEDFDRVVEPMFREIEYIDKAISKLTRARDLLLPRLMDGRIPVYV